MMLILMRRRPISMCLSWMVVFLEDPILVFSPSLLSPILYKSPLVVGTSKFKYKVNLFVNSKF
jgi:hypothetical protein